MLTMGESIKILQDERFIYDPAIKSKIDEAVNFIKDQLKELGEDALAISFNGGKDCTLLLGILSKCINKGTQIQGFCSMTGSSFKEIQEFITICQQKFTFLKMNVYEKPLKDSLRDFLHLNPRIKGILIGNRRSDPNSKDLKFIMPTDLDWPQVLRIHPLLDWSYSQVWHGIYHLEIPYCSLYDHGYSSLGDSQKTYKNKCLVLDNEDLPAYLLQDETTERQGR